MARTLTTAPQAQARHELDLRRARWVRIDEARKAHRRQVRRLVVHVICITVSGLIAFTCVYFHRSDLQLAMLPLGGNLVQEVLDLLLGLA
jgi:hypothetical protein